MKVFEFICKSEYGGGCAIVIADDIYQAFDTLVEYEEISEEYTDTSHCIMLEEVVPAKHITKPIVVTTNFYM